MVPARRPFPLRRVASGAVAGVLAGTLLHALLVATDALRPIARAVPVGGPEAVATVQLVASAGLGLAFAALPVTGGWPRGLAWGLGYGAAVWLVGDVLLVRLLVGAPLVLDRAALLGLAGRLLWGAALGLAFVGVMVALFRTRQERRRAAA